MKSINIVENDTSREEGVRKQMRHKIGKGRSNLRQKGELKMRLGLTGVGVKKKPTKLKNIRVVEQEIKQKIIKKTTPKTINGEIKMVRSKLPIIEKDLGKRKPRYQVKASKNSDVMVPVNETKAQREIINAQLKKRGMLKDLGRMRPITTVEQDLPQVSTIDIVVEPYVNHFVNLACQWPWFLFSKKIGADVTTSTSIGVLGQLYMTACVVALDLYQSMIGGQSYFNTVPEQYLELFRALGIKERFGHKYSWDIPTDQPLFGPGGFLSTMVGNPTGSFPLFNGDTNVSLSWVVSDGPNALLNTTLPALTDTLVFDEFYSVAMDLFSQLSDIDGHFKLISTGSPTMYDKSIGAFAACSPLNDGIGENNDFCAFTNEVIIFPYEYWVAMIGIAFSAQFNPNRAGTFSFHEYQTGSAYGLRLIQGYRGKKPPIRPRYKYIYLEECVLLALVAMVQADLFNNEQYGADIIDQNIMTKSVCGAIFSGDFLAGIAAIVVNRLWGTTWLSADKTRTADYPLFGMKYYTAQITQFISCIQALVESLASSMPFVIRKGLWEEAYCAVLVCRGAMYANIFESNPSGDSTFLQSFVQHLYPSSTITAYNFNPLNTSGMTDILDPDDVVTAQFLGTSTPDSMMMYNTVTQAQEGNYATCIADANVHMDNTILHYSKIGVLPEQSEEDKTENNDGTLTPIWTDYGSIQLTGISNIIPFSPNLTSDDMTKVLPVSLVNQILYQGIFNEIVSLPMDQYGVTNIVDLDMMSYIGFAHHFSGDGFESSKINDVKIVQQQGGGFFGQILSTTGNILTGIGI
jgi:hypothetical protein